MTDAEIYSFVAAIMGFVFLLLGIGLIVAIIQLIAFWKVYKKAGKGGWEAIVPFYNNYVLVEISGLEWWWFLLYFAPMVLSFIAPLAWLGPIVSLFATFNTYYNLSKKFNKGVGFAIGLTLATPIFASILGFSKKCVYDANVAVSSNGIFGEPEVKNNIQPMNNYQPNPAMQPMNNVQPNPAMQPMNNYQPNPAMQPMNNVQPNPAMQPMNNYQPNPAMQPMNNVQPNPAMQPMNNVQPNPAMQPMNNVQPNPAMQPMNNVQPNPAMQPTDNVQQNQ